MTVLGDEGWLGKPGRFSTKPWVYDKVRLLKSCNIYYCIILICISTLDLKIYDILHSHIHV